MNQDYGDLLPLFVGEARTRLERLTTLAPAIESDRGAAAEARRELHTLKGAARMLGVPAIAELSHEAESLLVAPRPGARDLLLLVVDRLAQQIDLAARGERCESDPELAAQLRAGPRPAEAREPLMQAAPGEPVPRATPAAEAGATPATSAPAEVRLSTSALDQLAEQATQMRILSRGFTRLLSRLLDLAHLAERGTTEAEPRQVMAALSSQLRHAAAALEGQERRLIQAADAQLEVTLALQMQPLRGVLQRLSRHARELARELGRELDVHVEGEQALLDRRILVEIEEALLHLVRNAVDHGIEAPEARRAAGKPARGSLLLRAVPANARLEIVVADDGAGIDPNRVLAAARAADLVDAESAAPDREAILRLVFNAGFSTRETATELSGRGIGLDAVAAAARRAGGEVALETQLGRGTTVTLRLPVSRRGESVYVVRAGTLRLALPSVAVSRVAVLGADELVEVDGRTLLRRGQELVPALDLARYLGERPSRRRIVVEGEVFGQCVRAVLDGVEGEEEVVLRPPPVMAGLPPIVDAMALLSSGEPVAVLSPRALADAASRRPEERSERAAAPARPARILLVDDSLVTREMVRRLLDDAGFDVTTAGSAAEALRLLGQDVFNCLISDVEMPGMDGFELTRQIRASPRLAELPVLIVSTLDRAEDRLRGLQAGADAYLTKQSLDADELARIVRRLTSR